MQSQGAAQDGQMGIGTEKILADIWLDFKAILW